MHMLGLQDILIGAGKLKDDHTVTYSLPGEILKPYQNYKSAKAQNRKSKGVFSWSVQF